MEKFGVYLKNLQNTKILLFYYLFYFHFKRKNVVIFICSFFKRGTDYQFWQTKKKSLVTVDENTIRKLF